MSDLVWSGLVRLHVHLMSTRLSPVLAASTRKLQLELQVQLLGPTNNRMAKAYYCLVSRNS